MGASSSVRAVVAASLMASRVLAAQVLQGSSLQGGTGIRELLSGETLPQRTLTMSVSYDATERAIGPFVTESGTGSSSWRHTRHRYVVAATYGVLQSVDVSVFMPIVRTRSSDRLLLREDASSDSAQDGNSTGAGDAAVRARWNVLRRGVFSVSALGGVSLPTSTMVSGPHSRSLGWELGVAASAAGNLLANAAWRDSGADLVGRREAVARLGVGAQTTPWDLGALGSPRLALFGELEAGLHPKGRDVYRNWADLSCGVRVWVGSCRCVSVTAGVVLNVASSVARRAHPLLSVAIHTPVVLQTAPERER